MKARNAATLLIVVLLVVLAGADSAYAPHLGYKPCKNMKFKRASATHVQSNYGCANARTTLRKLLAHGVGGLPKATTKVGVWGCRNTGYKHFYVCERRRSGTQASPSIVFAARRRH